MRIWLHDIKTLTELDERLEEVRRTSGEDANIEIESCGYGRICLDVIPAIGPEHLAIPSTSRATT